MLWGQQYCGGEYITYIIHILSKNSFQNEFFGVLPVVFKASSALYCSTTMFKKGVDARGQWTHWSQRSVRPVPQSVKFNIVSRCFENKNNNSCETNICKNAICLLFTNYKSIIWQPC